MFVGDFSSFEWPETSRCVFLLETGGGAQQEASCIPRVAFLCFKNGCGLVTQFGFHNLLLFHSSELSREDNALEYEEYMFVHLRELVRRAAMAESQE